MASLLILLSASALTTRTYGQLQADSTPLFPTNVEMSVNPSVSQAVVADQPSPISVPTPTAGQSGIVLIGGLLVGRMIMHQLSRRRRVVAVNLRALSKP